MNDRTVNRYWPCPWFACAPTTGTSVASPAAMRGSSALSAEVPHHCVTEVSTGMRSPTSTLTGSVQVLGTPSKLPKANPFVTPVNDWSPMTHLSPAVKSGSLGSKSAIHTGSPSSVPGQTGSSIGNVIRALAAGPHELCAHAPARACGSPEPSRNPEKSGVRKS